MRIMGSQESSSAEGYKQEIRTDTNDPGGNDQIDSAFPHRRSEYDKKKIGVPLYSLTRIPAKSAAAQESLGIPKRNIGVVVEK